MTRHSRRSNRCPAKERSSNRGGHFDSDLSSWRRCRLGLFVAAVAAAAAAAAAVAAVAAAAETAVAFASFALFGRNYSFAELLNSTSWPAAMPIG